ncbi:MAG: DUF2335 domain-containing protein [Chloroflexi bacterium]|nr:DUF2335 domain-containing protein [Chloroflexota bacterium]
MTRSSSGKGRASQKDKSIQKPKEQAPGNASLIIAQHSESHYSGPLPPPEILAGYNEVVPDSASLLIEQFLEQGRHRRELEKFVVTNDVKRANWGLVAGFIISMVSILGSFYTISLGYKLEGLTGVIVSLGSLVAAFFYGTYSRKKERQEKEQALLEKLEHR